MNWEGLHPAILAPALAAGVLVLATHVPLGRDVLGRGIIFIDLAIAQIAVLGVVATQTLGWEPHGLAAQAVAMASALLGGAALHWCESRWPHIQEALIGTAFVLAATGAILLLSASPHGSEQLRELLAGQILWTGWEQLGPAALVTLALLALWFGLRARAGRLLFYLVFPIAITVSVQLVGVYLVFASLIIPALATRRTRMWIGYALGLAGYLLGLVLSALYDLPAGPLIVWMLAAVSLLPLLLRGAIARQEIFRQK